MRGIANIFMLGCLVVVRNVASLTKQRIKGNLCVLVSQITYP